MSEAVADVSVEIKNDDVNCLPQPYFEKEASSGKTENSRINTGGKNTNTTNDGRRRPKRKTRRGKPWRRQLKPYSKLSWQERREQEDKQSRRADQVRERLFKHGQAVAPYNTTQFLMDDHGDLPDLDVHLKAVTTNTDNRGTIVQRQNRARDSSFSVDSEEEYFYSSPEDEEEFLTKEFANEYEDSYVERLNAFSKSQLIKEYIELKKRSDDLERRLKKSNSEGRSCTEVISEVETGDTSVDMAEKLRIFQQEIDKLVLENEQLRVDNDRLRRSFDKAGSPASAESTVDSDSDSTSSTGSSSSSGGDDAEEKDESPPHAECLLPDRPCDVSVADQ